MTVTVTIPKTRNELVTVAVDGVEGRICLKTTLSLRKMLVGAKPLTRKPEFDREVDEEEKICVN
jgi:hypothetical protein